MSIKEFQKDIQKGMTLSEALPLYNLTLQEAFHQLHYKVNTKPPTKRKKRLRKYTNEQYIQARQGKYYLRKSRMVKGRKKTLQFGTYNSLDDAIRMREALKIDGWHQRHVDQICKELGIERASPKSKVRYH